MKIATHNSSTGEKPANFLSWLVIPFARTQSKNIAEQLNAGCRMFDLRAKEYNNEYHAAHGLFTTKRTLESIVQQLNSFGETIYATITYEGKLETDEKLECFKLYVNHLKNTYKNIVFGTVAVKYTDNDTIVDWVTIDNGDKIPSSVSKFLALNGKNWQTYLPIPWLWKKIYYNKPEFNDEIYTYVDFL